MDFTKDFVKEQPYLYNTQVSRLLYQSHADKKKRYACNGSKQIIGPCRCPLTINVPVVYMTFVYDFFGP